MTGKKYCTDSTSTSAFEERGSINIDILPRELLVMIFSYLEPEELCHVVALVNKQWLDVSRDPELWKELKIRAGYDSNLFELMKKPLSFSTMLRSLIVTSNRISGTLGGSFFKPTLERLEVREMMIDKHLLDVLLKHCHTLKTVVLTLCRCDGSKGTEINLVDMMSKLTHLTDLVLDNIPMRGEFYNECLKSLGRYCTGLESVTVGDTPRRPITDECLRDLTWNRRNSLRKVNIKNCCRITDDGMDNFALCRHLTELELICCSNISDRSLKALSNLKLTHFSVENGLHLTPEGLKELFSNPSRKSLRVLNLEYLNAVDDDVIKCIADNSPNLEKLTIVICLNVTDDGLVSIKDLPKRKELCVRFCYQISRQSIDVLRHNGWNVEYVY